MNTTKFPIKIDASLTAADLLKKIGPENYWWESEGPKDPDDPEWDSPIVPNDGSCDVVVELLAPFSYAPGDADVLSWEADYLLWYELQAALLPDGPLHDYRLATPREVIEACAQHGRDFLDEDSNVVCLGGFWKEKPDGVQKLIELYRHTTSDDDTEVDFGTSDPEQPVIKRVIKNGTIIPDLVTFYNDEHEIGYRQRIAIVRK